MKDPEEIDDFFNRMEKETEAEIKRQTDFLNTLEVELVDLAFECYPEYKKYRAQIEPDLEEDLHEGALMMTETMDYIINMPEKDRIENTHPTEINYREAAEGEDENEKRDREFLYKCHEKVKEVINRYFPEIVDLSGNDIRDINFSAYCSILNFKTAFIYLINNIEE